MTKFFYSHLVNIESLEEDLGTLKVTDGEKTELMDLAHIHIHQAVIDTVLSQLKEEDKKQFLEHLTFGEDEKIWKHLESKVENIEDKIKSAAEQIKKELKEDIQKIKKAK